VKIYAVGGAVRDELLDFGYPIATTWWSAHSEEMERLATARGQGLPGVPASETHEEYALARTERKVARGYKGFQIHAAPDVTLDQDLERRDLTINALARDEEGRLIDPFGGAADLERGLLRHVSSAFVEDPVRILRVARFAARFGFAVAPETMALMRSMVANGEAAALVPSACGRNSPRPDGARPCPNVRCARASGPLGTLLPELGLAFEDARPANDASRVLVRSLQCAAASASPLLRDSRCLCSARPPSMPRARCASAQGAGDCRDLAVLAPARRGLRRAPSLRAPDLLGLLERCDAFRRPSASRNCLPCALRERGRLGWVPIPYLPGASCGVRWPRPGAWMPRRSLRGAKSP